MRAGAKAGGQVLQGCGDRGDFVLEEVGAMEDAEERATLTAPWEINSPIRKQLTNSEERG